MSVGLRLLLGLVLCICLRLAFLCVFLV